MLLPLVYLATLALDATRQAIDQTLFDRVEDIAVERTLVRLELLAAVVLVVEAVLHLRIVRSGVLLAAYAPVIDGERVALETPALSFRRYIYKMRLLRRVHQAATGGLAVRLVVIMIAVELTGACIVPKVWMVEIRSSLKFDEWKVVAVLSGQRERGRD